MAAMTISKRHLMLVIAGVVLLAAFWIGIVSAFVTHGPQGWSIRAYDLLRVRSSSMQPTIRAGETVLADMSYYRDHTPSRGELAIYHLADSADALIKSAYWGWPATGCW